MPEPIEMRKHERMTEVLQHSFAVVLFAELQCGELHQRSDVAPEALWRRIIEVVRDVGDGKSGVLEEACRAN